MFACETVWLCSMLCIIELVLASRTSTTKRTPKKYIFSFSSFSISIQCSVSRWVYDRSHVSSCWLTWCSIVFLGHVFHEKSVQVVILEIWIFWHWSDDPSYFCVHVYLLIDSRTQGLIIGTSVSWKECADIKSNYTFWEKNNVLETIITIELYSNFEDIQLGIFFQIQCLWKRRFKDLHKLYNSISVVNTSA